MVLEEYPLNRYTPQQDEYRPIESEDEIIGEQDIDDESSEEDLQNEQHCELLMTSVNRNPIQEDVAPPTLSARKSPSLRLTRSRDARNGSSIVLLKHNLIPSFQ